MWHHLALRLGDYTLPETEAICREVLSLPMSSELTAAEVQIVSDAICEFFGTYQDREKEVENAVTA